MNKKLLVLAVTSAVAATSAYADTPNVNVYGKLYPQYMTASAKGATSTGTTVSTLSPSASGANAPSKQFVNSQNSYVGFKGDVDVGGGMKGWFQVEQSVELDTGTGTFSSRNSAAGISGNFGNVFLGNWDTVYKQLGDPVSFLGISSGNVVSTSGVLSKPGFSSGSSSQKSSFHLRQANNIEYDSPTIAGLTLMINYSPDESKTSGVGNAKNAWLRDIGLKWEAGPLYVALANETHNDFFGGSLSSPTALQNISGGAPTTGAHSKDTANRLSVKYALPTGTEIGVDYSQIEYKETGQAASGRFQNYKHNSYALVGTQKLGNIQLAAAYVKSEKGTCSLSGGVACNTNGLEASMIDLGAKYDFNKRTSVFAIYSKITNGTSARHNNVGSSDLPFGVGADPEALAAGVIVSF